MKWVKREVSIKPNKSDNIVAKLLKIRGISDQKQFLNPTSKVLNDPCLLANIKEAADKIVEAIKNNKKIAISFDVDVDGVTSGAIMYRYLKPFTDNLHIVYHQREDGHGVENQQVPDDTELLIILDSSTNSTEACKELSEKGVDIVIIDHHSFEEDNPYALIVNPQLDNSPNKSLSGAGVTYKVIQIIDDTIGSGTVEDYLDLVAVGMYADMMDVSVLENRYLITQGLKNIKNTGILAVLQMNGTNLKDINSQTIGFGIAPLINGVARMGKIELAIDLLITDDMQTCLDIASEMKLVNEQRKDIEKELYEKFVATVNPNDKVIICIHDVESKSFNGLIANKIAQEFQRPTLVMRDHGGSLAGSYRSYSGFPMREFLNDKSIKKYTQYSVGHEFAGGIGLKSVNLEKLKKVFNEKLEGYEFESKIVYDLELDANDVTPSLIKDIEKFDYLTGEGFPVATILVKDLFVEENPKVLGKTKETVKIKCDGIDVIKFKVDEDWANDVGVLDSIEVIGQLKLNNWQNWKKEIITTMQIVADDYRLG